MLSNAPLSQMEEMADRYIKTAFPKALSTAYFTYAAIILLTIGLSLLVYSVLRNKSAYISRFTTEMKYGYVLMAASFALAVLQFANVKGAASVVIALLSLFSAVGGIAGLFLKRRFGPAFLLTSLWLSLPFKEMLNIPAVYTDYAQIGEYNAASKMGVFAADKMILGRITVLMLIVSAITVFTVAYYVRRRYFFKSLYEQEFEGVSKCPQCLSPIVSKANYCSACGENIKDLPSSVLNWEPLEKPEYCSDCGKLLNANGDCVNCNPSATFKNHVTNLFGMSVSGAVKYIILCVLIVVMVFVPVIKGNALNQLVSGSAQVNNTYVEKFSAWKKNPSVSKDKNWLSEYDEASNALFRFNARGFDVQSERLDYKDLFCYINYFEASYLQMAVLQKTNEAIHNGTPEKAEKLGAYFNETLNRQQNSLMLGLKMNLSPVKLVGNVILDSGRFYLSFIPAEYLAAVFLAIGILSTAAAVIILLRNSGEVFKTKAVLSIPAGEKSAVEQRHKAFVKKERLTTVLGITVAVLALGVITAVSIGTASSVAPSYESCLHSAYYEDGTQLLSWLSDCRTNPEKAKTDLATISASVDDCIEKLELIIKNPKSDSEAVSVSKELLVSMKELKQCLDSGNLPDNDLTLRIIELLENGMSIDTERLLNNAFDILGEAF